VTALILIFPDWKKEFHVDVDASSITLGVIISHLGEGNIDYTISFSRRKFSIIEKNYTNME
jgi:hypothetical protein